MAQQEINVPMSEIVKREKDNKGSPLAREQAIIIGTHQHYKGGIYLVTLEAPHSETGEPMIIRKHLWPYEFSHKVVPKDVFLQDIAEGVPRYRPITSEEKLHAEEQLRKKYA